MDLEELLANDRYSKYFYTQSGRVLAKRIVKSGEHNPVLCFIKAITSRFITATKPNRDGVLTQFIHQISDAMMGLDHRTLLNNILGTRIGVKTELHRLGLLVAVAASVGDIHTCSGAIQKLDTLFESGSEFFPNALNASVASGHLEVLRELPSFIDTQIKDMPKARD